VCSTKNLTSACERRKFTSYRISFNWYTRIGVPHWTSIQYYGEEGTLISNLPCQHL
jgi:hypothetical protein